MVTASQQWRAEYIKGDMPIYRPIAGFEILRLFSGSHRSSAIDAFALDSQGDSRSARR
jgi:hypothetical protein